MKRMRFFKKTLSFTLAALMAVTSIVPAFAQEELPEGVTIEVEEGMEETEESLDEAEEQETVVEEETAAAEEGESSETIPPVEETYPYIIMLPNRGDISYQYDGNHYSGDLSTGTYDILLYEEGEPVQFGIETELDYRLLNAVTEGEFLSMEQMNGQAAFTMPAYDLKLQVSEPEKEEPVIETEPEHIVYETEPDAVLMEEDPEYPLEENADMPETEITEAAEEKEDEISDVEDEILAEDTDEEELMEETEEVLPDIFPEDGSVIELNAVQVWKHDVSFDAKAYTPEYALSDYVEITYVDGEIPFDEGGFSSITYQAAVKENPERSWYLILPVEVVPLQGTATVGSEGFEDLMFNEQSEEYTGVIPMHKEETITGKHYTVNVGEDFDLKDLNLDYDLGLYNVGLYDAGAFDVTEPGSYEVLYEVNSYNYPDYRFKVLVTVDVVEPEYVSGTMTVVVRSGALKAAVATKSGEPFFAGVGTSVVSQEPIDFLTVTSVRNEEINPVLHILKNGMEMENPEQVILSENLENNIFTADLNENLEIGEDSYVVFVEFPDYDPTENGARKSAGGLERPELFGDGDSVMLLSAYADEFDGATEETIQAMASSDTVAKKTFYGIGSVIDLGGRVWNYNPAGWAYNEVKVGFHDSFLQEVKGFCDEYGLIPATELPESGWTSCYSGHNYAAWPNKSYCTGTDATVSLIDTDGDGVANRVSVTFRAYGDSGSGYQSMAGSFSRTTNPGTGSLKIVKYTSSPNFVKLFDTVKISTSFGIYDDASCSSDSLVTTLKFSPSEDATSSSATTELEPGSYYVKEISRCPGHRSEIDTVYGPFEVKSGETTTVDDADKTKVGIGNEAFYFKSTIVVKKDSKTGNPVSGAIFKVTATICETDYTWYFKTDSKGQFGYDATHKVDEWNGNASDALFSYTSAVGSALPVCTIKIQEVEAPAGYLLNPTVYTMKISAVKDGEGRYSEAKLQHDPIEVTEDRDEGYIEIQKYTNDKEVVDAVSAVYSLEGAVYGIYEDKACKTTPIQQLVTNKDGYAKSTAIVKDSEKKTYYVKEIKAPTCGMYELDPLIYLAEISTEKPVACVKSVDLAKRGSMSLEKKLNNNTMNLSLAGIHFTLTHEKADVLKNLGHAEAYTDEKGFCEFHNLLYGTWILEEDPDSVPKGYKPMEPKKVVIDDEHKSVKLDIVNVQYEGYLTVKKVDAETGKKITRGNATFKIYDNQNKEVEVNVKGVGKTVAFTTGSSGEVQFTEPLPAGTYTLKEIQAPAGYQIFESGVKFTIGTENSEENPVLVTIKDSPLKKPVSVTKIDQVTGKNCGAGFTFKVVAAEDIVDGSGTVRAVDGKELKAGTIVDTMTTKENGIAVSKDLYLGKYYVQETTAKAGYKVNPNKYSFELTVESSTGEVKNVALSIEDEPVMKPIQITKIDAVSNTRCGEGFIFEIRAVSVLDGAGNVRDGYEKGTLIETLSTGKDGIATSKPVYFGTYEVKEIRCPAGYKLNSKVFTVSLTDEISTQAMLKLTVPDQPLMKKISVTKIDKDSQNHCGAGFSFKVVAAENIVDASGAVRVVDGTKLEKGVIVDTITTGEDGIAVSKDLFLGKYYVQETTVKEGYKLNPSQYDVDLNQDPSMLIVNLDIENAPFKRPIQVKKVDAATGNVCGAGFTFEIRSVSVVDHAGKVRKGFEKDALVETVTTGSNGIATSKELYVGTYSVTEIACAPGYTLNKTVFTVEVKDENHVTTPVVFTVKDEPLMKDLAVTKIDKESGNHCGAGFTFKVVAAEDIKDASGAVRVAGSTKLVKDTVVDTITTDENGIAKSKALYLGTYYVQETTAKPGYLVNEEKYVFNLDTDPKVKTVELSIEDAPLMRPIEILKVDEDSKKPLGAGVTFEIRAEKVVDDMGNVRKGYEKGTVVDSIKTDDHGTAKSKDLYVGTYTVKEKTTVNGYILNGKTYTVEIPDEEKSVSPVQIRIGNKPLMKTLAVTKIDAETGNHCGSGFKFNVVAAEDVKDASHNVRKGWEKDAIVDTITTGEDGIAVSKPLYLGRYYVQEIEVNDEGYAINHARYHFELTDTEQEDQPMNIPMDIADGVTTLNIHKIDTVAGKALTGIVFRIKEKDAADQEDQLYTTDSEGNLTVKYLKKNTTYQIQEVSTLPGYNLLEEILEFTVDGEGLINGESSYGITITNQPNEVHISKVDITNGEELPGATLVITDSDGNVFDEWTSTEEEHVIYEMPSGTYTLTETTSPDGYEVEEAIEFEIVDSLVVQKVVMKDSPFRKVEISKRDVTNDEELPGATLVVKDAEGIVVDEWVSTEEPHMMELHSGLYTLTETIPADGFVTADTIEFEVIKTTEEDYDVMPVIMYDEVTKLVISKTDVTTSEELPGAELVIRNEEGEIVEEWTSTEEEHYIERLPIGTYTLTEITAPDGYEVAEEITFEITDTPEIQHVEMHDSPYREMIISKKDLTTSEEIAGAHLQILNESGEVVEEWVSGEGTDAAEGQKVEPHYMTLPSGKYTLVETRPADGYVTAERVAFEVFERNTEGDMEVQTVEMFDDVTKVEISKKDVTNDEELPGATLVIRDQAGNVVEEWVSTNEAHYIEKLPIGEYTLTETIAPNGYDVAETLTFTVLDTGEIQHVTMFDSPTPTVPKTGDDLNIQEMILIGTLILIFMGTGILFIRKGKKRSK